MIVNHCFDKTLRPAANATRLWEAFVFICRTGSAGLLVATGSFESRNQMGAME
jgi:hypothetical protein